MKKRTAGWMWGGVFVCLYLAAIHFWNWGKPVTLWWGGWPSWVYYFILLQLLLVVSLWWFARKYWR